MSAAGATGSGHAHRQTVPGVEVGVRAMALAGLYAAGATLALLTLILPHAAGANEVALLLIVGVAYLVACYLSWQAATLAAWVLPLALAWGTTLITGVAYFSDESPSPLIFFYLWIFLYSAYFFDDRQLVAQVAYVGVAYGALLLAAPPEGGVAPWLIVAMGALAVAAILIRSMRMRVGTLIERLYETARTDPLTGLPNRRGFRELLDLELERARRRESRVAVIVGDLDHFREVNDRSGHHVGDAALRRVAELLNEGKRRIDAIARIGGEEFAVILPDTEAAEAMIVAERLRERIRDEFAAEAITITISFGIATYPAHGETAASVLRAGDEALFAAKGGGRNRSVLHTAELHRLLEPGGDRDVEAERFTAAMLELAEAVDLRFSGSARHSETVGRYAEMMAVELGLDEQRVGRVRLAGMLHDIGKALVPETILQKSSGLSDEEFGLIRKHPGYGARILDHPSLAGDVAHWVGAHHERPDGRGYPQGLSGDQIPLEARILAVADAYEAMTSDRAYRDSIGHEAARRELRRCAPGQFDPRAVEVFIGILERESERAGAVLRS